MKRIILIFISFILALQLVSAAEQMFENYTLHDDFSGPSKTNWRGQTFRVGTTSLNTTFFITKVQLYLNVTAPTNANFTILITAVNTTGGVNNTNITLGSILATGITDGLYNITVNPAILQPGMTYSIQSLTNETATTVRWGFRTTGTYVGGNATQSANGGQTFTFADYDQRFYIFGEAASGLTVSLVSPSDGVLLNNATVPFFSSITPLALNVTNATLIINYQNGSLFNRSVNQFNSNATVLSNWNITGLFPGNYVWNVFGCAKNNTFSACAFGPQNNTFSYGYQITGESLLNDTVEGANNYFAVNLSLAASGQLQSATLWYDGTNYTGSFTNQGSNYTIFRNLLIPATTQAFVNRSFFWQIIFTNGAQFNITNRTQQVRGISIDNCASNTIPMFNFTMKDEDTQVKINATAKNTTMEVDIALSSLDGQLVITTFNATFNRINPATICIQSGVLNTTSFRLDGTIRYDADDYVSEFYNLQNFTVSNTTLPQLVDLFDLLTTQSQSFLITFKDTNFLPVDDAIVDIARRYIGEAASKTVEIPRTDQNGQTIAHLVLQDVIYTLVFKKNGNILATFDNVIAICQNQVNNQCTLNLNQFQGGIEPEDFNEEGGIAYNLDVNTTTRVITLTFTSLDSRLATVQMNITTFGSTGNNTICSPTLTTTTGVLTCTVPGSIGNNTVYGQIFGNGEFVSSFVADFRQKGKDVFGSTGGMLVLILMLTIPLMFIGDEIGMLIGGIAGLILAILLNLYTGGSLIGVTATIIWAVIAFGAVIWLFSKKRE